MSEDGEDFAGGTRFDFARVLAHAPETADPPEIIAAVIAAGDLIRRARNRRRMSQVTLALRAGTTQPYVSDIERGLGESGPSVGTLARLLRELDDELLLLTCKERDLWIAGRIRAAEAAFGELAERIAAVGARDMTMVMSELSKANQEDRGNPFRNTLINGVILGMYMTLRAQPETTVDEGQKSAASRIIEDMSKNGLASFFRTPPQPG